jgi:hypothetical protein
MAPQRIFFWEFTESSQSRHQTATILRYIVLKIMKEEVIAKLFQICSPPHPNPPPPGGRGFIGTFVITSEETK